MTARRPRKAEGSAIASGNRDRVPDRQTALTVLRECGAALGERLEPAERARIVTLFEQAMDVLERRSRLVQRVGALERQMAEYPPGERAAAIMARLQLTRATYYRLRVEAGFGESHRSETGA